jgi:hypothetical protein
MQDRNQPLRAGRRRGQALAQKTKTRAPVREVTGLPPAKTRNAKHTLADANAQARRLGIGQKPTPTQRRLNSSPPISAYRAGKRNARHKPEVHRSRRVSR